MSIIDIIYLLRTIVPNELILVMLHMLQWINIVDNVTNTIQKPVVWTRVFIYQFGRHHGGCAVYTTSKSLYGSKICRNAQRCSWPAWSLFTKILASSFITILLEIVPDRNRGWRCSPKSPNFLLNLNSAVRFCKSQNHKGSLTWCKLHTHHDVFQTDKWRPLFKPRAFGWCW